MALAIACSLAAPAAQAKGNFFVAGQTGRATYDDSGFDKDKADTRALSGGIGMWRCRAAQSRTGIRSRAAAHPAACPSIARHENSAPPAGHTFG
jgi:hypothetical protein